MIENESENESENGIFQMYGTGPVPSLYTKYYIPCLVIEAHLLLYNGQGAAFCM